MKIRLTTLDPSHLRLQVVRGRRELRTGLTSIAAIPMSQPDVRSRRCRDARAGNGDDLDDDPVREAAHDIHDHEGEGGDAQGDRQAADSRLVDAGAITMDGHRPSLPAR